MRSPDGVLFDFGRLEGNDCCCHLGLSSPCSSSVHESREVPPPAEEPGVGETRASSAHESFSTPVPAAPWSKRRRARPRQEELKRLVRTNCQPGCTCEADVKPEAAAESEAVEELELVDGEIIAGHNVAVLREEYGKFPRHRDAGLRALRVGLGCVAPVDAAQALQGQPGHLPVRVRLRRRAFPARLSEQHSGEGGRRRQPCHEEGRDLLQLAGRHARVGAAEPAA